MLSLQGAEKGARKLRVHVLEGCRYDGTDVCLCRATYLQVHSHQQCVSPRWTEHVTSHDCLLSGFQSYFQSSLCEK